MTEAQVIQFIAEKNTPAPITWGDYKKLQVLEVLFMCEKTNTPADNEVISIYTRLSEKDLKTTIERLVSEGVVCRTEHFLSEDGLLKLNYTPE